MHAFCFILPTYLLATCDIWRSHQHGARLSNAARQILQQPTLDAMTTKFETK